jgi:hypothetical protein
MTYLKTFFLIIPFAVAAVSVSSYMAYAKTMVPSTLLTTTMPLWQNFSFGEGTFDLNVPDKPKCQHPDKGYFIQSHFCTASSEIADVTIIYQNLPSSEILSKEQLEAMYFTLLQDVATNAGGEVISSVDIVTNKIIGKSYEVKVARGIIRYRSFIHRGFIASVGVALPVISHTLSQEKSDTKIIDIERVLESFTPQS